MTADYYGVPVVREGGDKNKVEVEMNEIEKWRMKAWVEEWSPWFWGDDSDN